MLASSETFCEICGTRGNDEEDRVGALELVVCLTGEKGLEIKERIGIL